MTRLGTIQFGGIAPQCCSRCRLRPDACVCAEAPRLNVSTRLIVIMHSKEWRRSTNTGYLARLATTTGEVRLHGAPNRALSCAGIDSGAPSTLVLFPGRGAQPLTPQYIAALPRPLTLLVPDGNWTQAKNMMRRVSMLSRARPVRLEGSNLDLDVLRHNARADRMSTFEAIAQALGVIEGQAIEDHLLEFFRQVVHGMMRNSRRAANSSKRRTS